ncbi:MAG: energy-coupling factor ABC transporter ATP-binding protein, partial [Actinobacteria bacterium]|nr:energy-coupling factor ABC transporter ATP-binding protein [Actinomycetota bacterium]
MVAAVQLDKLTYSYEASGTPRVLDEITWEVEAGETVLLVGPSGCGKTTLLLTLNGLIPHEISLGAISGRVTCVGRDVASARVAEMSRDIGVVFQNPDEQLTCLYVEDEIAFGPENLNIPRAEVWNRIEEAFEIVGLGQYRDKVVHGLSGGQKQRLALASCLAMRPKLLLLDGPISNTDPLGSENMLEMINHVTKMQGLTTVIAEYDIDRILRLADRVVVLDRHGRLVAQGSPREVCSNLDMLGDEIGLWTPQVAEAARELLRRGFPVSHFPLSEEEGEKMFRTILGPSITHPAPGQRDGQTPEGTSGLAGRKPVIQV